MKGVKTARPNAARPSADNPITMGSKKSPKTSIRPSDLSVWSIMVRAMEDFGAHPARVYAFQKTGIYVCDENRKRLQKGTVKAFEAAVAEYGAARIAKGLDPEPPEPRFRVLTIPAFPPGFPEISLANPEPGSSHFACTGSARTVPAPHSQHKKT